MENRGKPFVDKTDRRRTGNPEARGLKMRKTV
jgi:hypothetical protein